jgi:hypothetical protein
LFRVHCSLPSIATSCSPLTQSYHPFNLALQQNPCYPTEWIVPYDMARHDFFPRRYVCVTQPDHKGVLLHLLADYHEDLIRASYEPSLNACCRKNRGIRYLHDLLLGLWQAERMDGLISRNTTCRMMGNLAVSTFYIRSTVQFFRWDRPPNHFLVWNC